MCCVKAENLAHLITWSIQQGMTIFDILKMPFYHPVIEEALQAALYNALSQLDGKHHLVELERL
jgi:dihydrolipoamide dehydrogenase